MLYDCNGQEERGQVGTPWRAPGPTLELALPLENAAAQSLASRVASAGVPPVFPPPDAQIDLVCTRQPLQGGPVAQVHVRVLRPLPTTPGSAVPRLVSE